MDARRALLSQLSASGKYHPFTARLCGVLASIVRDEGRFADYESLARVSLEIFRSLGMSETSVPVVDALSNVANALRLEERWGEAAALFAAIDQATKDWEPGRVAFMKGGSGYVLTLYNTGQVEAGISAAKAGLEGRRARYGAQHFETAIAEGNLAIGLALAGRDAEARAAFAASVPVLTGDQAGGDDDSATPGARQRLARRILAAYVDLLARQPGIDKSRIAADTFVYADSMRGQSVAAAVAASSARVASRDSALGELARKEQDLRKREAADFATINAALALPPSERDEARVAALREEAALLGAEHDKVRLEIGVRFPDYADLIDPKPTTALEIQAALRPGEAFVSFYLGAEHSFVWAVPKSGTLDFAVIQAKAADVEKKVKKLREALEPNASSVSEIPAFDLAVAYELYELLLKPVEGAWRPARTLVVATNGALGSLPLGVLPTSPFALPSEGGLAFAAYRAVPWLARSHAVALVPSASAFRTLRNLPLAASNRAPLIGFGDPLFNKEQAREALEHAPAAPPREAVPLERRAAPKVDDMSSVTLASLPRLPDTADELASIASALGASGDILKLGVAANEDSVRNTDLSRYRIVAFATHGLVAGELDGLTQPALALTAPEVSGGNGDGLLTLEKVLNLKLDADWVVLSACNTGAADGAGAEAASGLGRAFFYAGTRAILVTNWSVHSQSARDLVTDLFRRQASDSKLTRAEALRQAELALMDGPGFADETGESLFSYAHPLFWAPYSIIGDGN